MENFYDTYTFMYKAWQRGDLLFEPIKPVNLEEFMRKL